MESLMKWHLLYNIKNLSFNQLMSTKLIEINESFKSENPKV